MRISVQWLRDFIETEADTTALADRLSVSGLEVEHIENWDSVPGGLRGFVVGEVMECSKHPNADKLSITKVNTGGETWSPIVCGAPNVAAGQKVIVALPGTEVTVPGKGTFTIGEAKIRGEISRGMICAEDECGLGNSHDGILVLPAEAPVGMPAAEYFHVVSDQVLEIGLTANRGDAASHLGVARDLAALFEVPVRLPHLNTHALPAMEYRIAAEENTCQRYAGLLLEGIKVGPSPAWMQNRLRTIGIEPRNNVVDCTNYVMHELGQPLHAFDADKIGRNITVRFAVSGEALETLDGQKRKLEAGDLIIAAENGPVALAGVLGGQASAIQESSTRVFIESACFSASAVRKTARRHGLSTDASFRFERGTDPEMCLFAAMRAADLMIQTAGGSAVGMTDYHPVQTRLREIPLKAADINRFAGMEIPSETVAAILRNLGFTLLPGGENEWLVKVPSWRNDVEGFADLAEEVMRIYGYDHVPLTGKMKASLAGFSGVKRRQTEQKVRRFLMSNGFYEIATNSLTSASHYPEEKQGQLVLLDNPLSSDMAVMRASLLHGMLESMAWNRNRKQQNIRFFEMGRVYGRRGEGFWENNRLGILLAGNRYEEAWERKEEETGFYDLKAIVAQCLQVMGTSLSAENVKMEEVSRNVLKKWDIEGKVWFAELDWDKATEGLKSEGFRVQTPPKFPFMRRDLSLVVDKNLPYAELEKTISKSKTGLLREVQVFDVYEGKPLEEGKKAIAIAFYLGMEDRTLTDAEADGDMARLMAAFEQNNGAVIRK
ncbi:MAG: phenylalanine--tRNA ligase subunit beta [Bacteroidetes bacterium]|nr:phenylalanine--tRNA ligase subunit beta [Bacteroidota bacterium]